MKKNIVFKVLSEEILEERFMAGCKRRRANSFVCVAILFLSLFFANQAVHSQTLDAKITFELKNQSLDKGLQLLGQLSGFRMSYSLQQVSGYTNVSLAKGTRSVDEILKSLLAKTSLYYEVKGKNILILSNQVRSKNRTSANDAGSTQAAPVTGKIIDANGEALAGVNVRVKDTDKATITDLDGNYKLDASPGDILEFSFIGFFPKEARVTTKTIYDQTLLSDSKLLDEVQVIGYGTTTRRLKTSGVATLKESAIQNQPTSTNFLQALQGKMAGVVINQTGGGLGTSPNIYIRGVNSITSGNSPLYIVDGVVINDVSLDNTGLTGGGLTGNNSHTALSSINQADIISIDILKDADATAIYGSRGANGVVLITTKRAQIGKTSFTLDANTGFSDPIGTKYMDLDQYLAIRKEAFAVSNVTPTATTAPDLLTWSQTDGTDWVKTLNSKSGMTYNVNGTLTGGTKALSYLASIGYNATHDTYFSDPNSDKISAKLNVNHTSENDRFFGSFNMSFSNEDFNPGFISNGSTAAMVYALPPNFPAYNADKSYFWGQGSLNSYDNPYAKAKSTISSTTVDYLTSAEVGYKIFKELTLKLAVSHNYQSNDNVIKLYKVSISTANNSAGDVPGRTIAHSVFKSFNMEPQLTYTKKISKGTLDALLGSTWFLKQSQYEKEKETGFQSEAFFDDSGAAGTTVGTSGYGKYAMRSWFGRANYNWDNKYIANATFRADGSSRFGTNNRWGQFGALGAAWLYSNESFVKKSLPWLSFGKLRASFGFTGNDNIPDYRYLSLYSTAAIGSTTPYSYAGASSLQPTYLVNKNIKWEKTRKIEVALENSFFSDRLSTSVAYFNNRTTDMLMNVTVPGTTGFPTQLQNFDGIVDNKGWEVEINSVNLKTKGFAWHTNLNITFAKNELVKMPTGANTSGYFVGKPIVRYTGYNFSRIDPATGSPLWINSKTGAEQTTADATSTYLGSSLPTVFGGLNNLLEYKGLVLDFSISFAKQTMTDALYYGKTPGTGYNMPTMLIGKYWQKAGDEARYPRLDYTGTNSSINYVLWNSPTFHEGYYLKMQNVSLSYNVPAQWISKFGIAGLNLYVRGQNLFYVTPGNNLGKDPERQFAGGASLSRAFVTGLNIKF